LVTVFRLIFDVNFERAAGQTNWDGNIVWATFIEIIFIN
jgi:hypothetical protein